MARRTRSFLFDNISKRLVQNTNKTAKEINTRVSANTTANTDILTKAEVQTVVSNTGINTLSDISIANVANEQVLQYNANTGKWENETLSLVSSVDGLTDTNLTSPSNGDYLVYSSSGSEWINQSLDLSSYVTDTDIADYSNTAQMNTAIASSNTAMKNYVDAEVAGVVNSAPSTLDTLNELAAALGDDANFATTTSTALGNRLRIDVNNQSLTGTEKTNALTNLGITSTIAELNILDGITATTTELNYVDGVTSNIQTQLDAKGTSSFSGAYADLTGKPSLFSGAYADLTGKPTIPTNNNQLTNGAGYLTSTDIAGRLRFDDYQTLTSAQKSIAASNLGLGAVATTNSYNSLSNRPTIPTDNSQLTNGAGYITNITTQTDPKYLRSDANDTMTGDLTIQNSGTPLLKLSDTANGGGGGASGIIRFVNTSGNAIGIGYTADNTASSDLIISTNAGSTYGGYLGLTAAAISDATADIILDAKTLARIQTPNGYVTIGPSNSTYTHFSTDRANYYFNTTVVVDGGGLRAYDASTDVRFPLYYDYDDTAYYMNAAGTSRFNIQYSNEHSTLATHGAGLRFWNSDAYKIYMSATSNATWGGSVSNAATSDYNMYFRMTSGTNRGFVFKNNTTAVAQIDASGIATFSGVNGSGQYLDVKYNATGGGGIRLYDNQGTLNTYLYGNGAGEGGLLDNDGSWFCRGRTGTSANIFYCDGNAELYVYTSYVRAIGSFRAPIYYDFNNTAYYAHLDSTTDSIRAAGDIVAYYSDERLKDIHGNIENALDKVCTLDGFYYTPNEIAQKLGYKKEKTRVGLSAQQVQAILPEVIKDCPADNKYMTVDYAKIVPLLVEAIKELKSEIEELKK